MKKCVGLALVLTAMLAVLPAGAQQRGRGGLMGLIAGCCFGPRAAADYNAGQEIHWREWCRLIPYVGVVFAIWDGADGYSGRTRDEFSSQYGSTFY